MPRERKVVLLGPPGAGKTSFFNKCSRPDGPFNRSHISTTLIDTKRITIIVNGREIEFDLVDTVGSSIFGESGTGGNVFVGVRVVLCLFNLSSRKSWEALVSSDRFDNLEYEIARRHGIMSHVDFIMIGSQCDKGDDKVDQEEINRFIENTTTKDPSAEVVNYFRLDRKYFRCSSLTGQGISEIVEYVAKTLASDDRNNNTDSGLINVNGKQGEEKQPSDDCCLIM